MLCVVAARKCIGARPWVYSRRFCMMSEAFVVGPSSDADTKTRAHNLLLLLVLLLLLILILLPLGGAWSVYCYCLGITLPTVWGPRCLRGPNSGGFYSLLHYGHSRLLWVQVYTGAGPHSAAAASHGQEGEGRQGRQGRQRR